MDDIKMVDKKIEDRKSEIYAKIMDIYDNNTNEIALDILLEVVGWDYLDCIFAKMLDSYVELQKIESLEKLLSSFEEKVNSRK